MFLGLRSARARRGERDALADATRRFAALQAAMNAAPGSYWSWPASGSTQDLGIGGKNLAALLAGSDKRIESFDDVTSAFAPGPARNLGDNVTALRAAGTPFTLTISEGAAKRSIEIHGARALGPDGKNSFDIVWFRDISRSADEVAELKQRAEEISSLSAGYRNTLDLTGIPVWVRGQGLNLAYCNRAFADAVEQASPAAAVAGEAEFVGGPTGWGR